MGKCSLTLEQIQIVNKRSDTAHMDNDWLIVTWFVGPNNVRTDTIQLRDMNGSPILDTGDALQSIPLDIPCTDADLVSASLVAVNLGSTDFSAQVNAAGDIAKNVSQKVAEIYLKAAQLFVEANPEIPFGEVWAKAIDKMSPFIVDGIGLAWDNVILPGVNEVIQILQALTGHPNCNGEILHDLVVFQPNAPAAPETWVRSYSAHSPQACGTDPHTNVVYTRERTADVLPQFPTTKPPQVATTEAHGEPAESWLHVWAEDPTSPSPLIRVTIETTRVAADIPVVSPLMAVTIREDVDLRFAARFETADDPVSPQSATLPFFQGNVFGTIKAWLHGALGPGDLVLDLPAATPALAGVVSAVAADQPPQALPAPRLAWTIPRTTAVGLALTSTLATNSVGGIDITKSMTVSVDAIVLPAAGVHLSLYTATVAGSPIAHFLRYTRAANDLYTYADVMLAQWNPLH